MTTKIPNARLGDLVLLFEQGQFVVGQIAALDEDEIGGDVIFPKLGTRRVRIGLLSHKGEFSGRTLWACDEE